MATFCVVNVWFMLLLLLLWLLCLCLLYNVWCDCGWIVVLLLCGVNVSVVLWLLQLGLCCTVLATVAGSEKAPVQTKLPLF